MTLFEIALVRFGHGRQAVSTGASTLEECRQPRLERVKYGNTPRRTEKSNLKVYKEIASAAADKDAKRVNVLHLNPNATNVKKSRNWVGSVLCQSQKKKESEVQATK